MALWDDAERARAAQRADATAYDRKQQQEAERQQAQLHEFVDAMRRLGVPTVECGFWHNLGSRDTKRASRAWRVAKMDGWVIDESPGSYDSWPSKLFVTLDGRVYSGALDDDPKWFSSPKPLPIELPIRRTFGWNNQTLAERLREIVTSHMK